MKIAIVGSRKFPQLQLVEWFIRDLPLGVTVVSGGAVGVDQAAEEYARLRGLETEIKRPDLEGVGERKEFTERYYERNQKIVDSADLVVAFTEKDAGGTWDTIKRARRAGKPVKIIRPSAFFPAEDNQTAKTRSGEGLNTKDTKGTKEFGLDVFASSSLRGESTPEQLELGSSEGEPLPSRRIPGAGPFQIKRVSLGSYAIRRKSYIDSVEWADIVAKKDSDPQGLADFMLPAFLDFFEKNGKFGVIHALTVPPRSKRNLEADHVMDILSQRLARELGCQWFRAFEPWIKARRGRSASLEAREDDRYGKIKVLPEVKNYIGKVVWIVDDISTTMFTLGSSVRGLLALEIHAHGLAYVYMA